MKQSHEDYLKLMLDSKKMEIKELNTQHRIAIAKYDAEIAFTSGLINSIERQLSESGN